jgi:glycosyltransferase involved in cell wall biosynthesis
VEPHQGNDLVLSLLRDVQARVAHHDQLLGLLIDPPSRVSGLLERVRGTADYDAAYSEDALVSIRVATYAGVDDLMDRAVPSMQAQDYDNWEAVIVGDATGRETEQALQSLRDPRIRFVDLPYRGPYPDNLRDLWHTAGARPFNTATRLSRGRWLAKLDQDDVLEPAHLSSLLQHARDSQAEVVYGVARLKMLADMSAPDQTLGTFPPRRGEFALTTALVHGSLQPVELPELSWLWDEPGDWAYTHRLWLGGARFSFLDSVVATVFVTPKPVLGGLDLVVDELRKYLRQVEEARDYWHQQAQQPEQARDAEQRRG